MKRHEFFDALLALAVSMPDEAEFAQEIEKRAQSVGTEEDALAIFGEMFGMSVTGVIKTLTLLNDYVSNSRGFAARVTQSPEMQAELLTTIREMADKVGVFRKFIIEIAAVTPDYTSKA